MLLPLTELFEETLQFEWVTTGEQILPLQPSSPLCLCAHCKSPLVASYYGSSDQSCEALHRTGTLANSLLILAHGPISTRVWFGTTVSVTLRLSLRGQGGAPATLLSGRKHTHKECAGWREMGSEKWEESITRLQTKEERSLVDGDEFQSSRGKVERHWLCARWKCVTWGTAHL